MTYTPGPRQAKAELPTEQHQRAANEVRAAVETLNTALIKAHNMGVYVDLDITEINTLQSANSRLTVRATCRKEI